ncbi:transporter [Costertonia aggregata]|uniref:Transporter n=1 Tax=Costertonia aggregata TaxID=343403 RepID=A0A7H9ARV9_9FLAO|nr:transporter [Costertonia aggregata]QLG46231.1 transporter [Costertonia aggregata]
MTRLLYICIFLYTAVVFSQGAWTRANKEVYSQLSFNSITYSNIFGNPDYDTERKISDNTLQLYTEYGVSNKTTLIFNLPLKLLNAGNTLENNTPITSEGSENTLGNITLGVKYQLYKKNWVVSGQLNVETNTGTFFQESGLRSGYDTWTLVPRINIGRSFDGFYIQGYTGVDVRFNDYSSNLRVGAEIGATPIKKLWTIGFLDFSSSFKNGAIVLPVENVLTGLYVNDQEYFAYGLKLIYEASNTFGFLANYAGALSGTNVPKSGVLGIGLYHKF